MKTIKLSASLLPGIAFFCIIMSVLVFLSISANKKLVSLQQKKAKDGYLAVQKVDSLKKLLLKTEVISSSNKKASLLSVQQSIDSLMPLLDAEEQNELLQAFKSFTAGSATKNLNPEQANSQLLPVLDKISVRQILSVQNADERIEALNERGSNLFIMVLVFMLACLTLILLQFKKDITGRRNAELNLTGNEEKYRSLIENAGAVMYTTDRTGHITFASQRVLTLTGYTATELIGMHFSVLVEPCWLERVAYSYTMQYRLRTAETTLEFVAITKTKQTKWVEQSAVLLFEDGKPSGFQCIVKDVSEKKRMLIELQASEERLQENQFQLQAILDNTTSIIFIKDRQGKYVLVNKQFCNMMELEEKNVIGRTDYDLTTRALADHYKAVDDEVISTGNSIEAEEIITTSSGVRNLLLTKFPLLDANKQVFGISGIATDITERVQQEEQLLKAKRDADEARKMQEQFLANMSHEIRTPMNGILGMINLMMDSSLNSQQKEFAAIIKRSANNLLVIVNDILDFSKIKAGKLNIEKIEFKLHDVVHNAVAMFNQRLEKKSLETNVYIDESLPEIFLGDPYRLNQVLVNLFGNAIKFTDQGSISLHVSGSKKNGDDIVLSFVVTDTGIGIPADRLPFIFDSFSQAGADIARRYGGTGLGLTICKQLLQLQGGDITVESKVGAGSRFSFYLPCKYRCSMSGQEEVQAVEQDYSKCLHGRRILVAEDNEINQRLIEHVLHRAGSEVTICSNGREAIEKLNHDDRYNLIIMDLQMPEMDGYAATREIREKLRMSIPIIAMTATALKGEHMRCLEVGMNDYMSKPFEFPDLYKRIVKLLHISGTAA